MSDLVRAELPDGSHANLRRSIAERVGYPILDEAPVTGAGRFKRTESADETPAEPPAGNASRDEWAEYAVSTGRVSAEDIADLGRDDLRDLFGAGA